MENSNLFGIYGRHSPEACPVNNRETAKSLIQWGESGDLPGALEKFEIRRVLGQYHSALEHTFLWIVEGEDAHSIQQFCLATPPGCVQ